MHLAFIILGGRDETRRVNLTGSRNVFAAAARHARRLVYTSSVAAYGFHADNPQPLTEDVRPRGSDGFYYSAQKAELEQALEEETAGAELETLRAAPVHRRRPGRADAAAPAPAARRCRSRTRARRSSSSTTTTSRDALVAATLGKGSPGAYNLAADGTITISDLARATRPARLSRSRASCSAPRRWARSCRSCPTLAQWVNAGRVPVVMDTAKARRELRLDAALQLARDLGRAGLVADVEQAPQPVVGAEHDQRHSGDDHDDRDVSGDPAAEQAGGEDREQEWSHVR